MSEKINAAIFLARQLDLIRLIGDNMGPSPDHGPRHATLNEVADSAASDQTRIDRAPATDIVFSPEGTQNHRRIPEGLRPPATAVIDLSSREALLGQVLVAMERLALQASDPSTADLIDRTSPPSAAIEPAAAQTPAVLAGEANASGVIPSFILNAHFLPGWPPLRPIEDVGVKQLLERVARDRRLKPSDIELLTYLANLGLGRRQFKRVVRILSKVEKRAAFLETFAFVMSGLALIVKSIREEMQLVAEELALNGSAATPANTRGRRRLDLG